MLLLMYNETKENLLLKAELQLWTPLHRKLVVCKVQPIRAFHLPLLISSVILYSYFTDIELNVGMVVAEIHPPTCTLST